MQIIYLALGWAAGILLAEQAELSSSVGFGISLLATIGLKFYARHPQGRLFCAILIVLGLGIVRFRIADPALNRSHVLHLNDQGALVLRGVVVDEPRQYENGLRLMVEAQEAAGHRIEGRVLVTAPRYATVAYGDRVELSGRLRTPVDFDTFAYNDYLSRQGVHSVMKAQNVRVLQSDQGVGAYAALLRAKDRARQFITQRLPEPHAALLQGILLGDDSGLSDQTREDFTRTGASHIIAISGFNMVVLAQAVTSLLKRTMDDKRAAVVAIMTILLYTVFVGMSGAVLRAALMSSLLIVAEALKRRTYVPASLAFAAFAISLYNPWTLWDIGFQLSFMAVLGMALFVPPLEKWLDRGLDSFGGTTWPRQFRRGLSEALVVTLAAQIATTPLIMHYFERVSIVALLVNPLIIPVQPFVLLFGVAGVLAGLIIPPLGVVILGVVWLLLSWTVGVIELLAGLSWADTAISLSPQALWIYFLLLVGLAIYQGVRPPWLKLPQGWQGMALRGALAIYAALALVLISSFSGRPDGRLHITFLDHGIVIQSPNGAAILVDGGDQPNRLLDDLADLLPARSRQLAAVIATSPDEETIAALPEVLERYNVGVLIIQDGQSYPALEERAAQIVRVSDGYTLTTDDQLQIEIQVADELVLRVEYGEASFLLTGNLTAEDEATLLANPYRIQASVLQVPSRGSAQASSRPFIEVVNPQVAVIQTDSDNSPAPIVLDRLSDAWLFRTDEVGRVEIVSDGKELWIYRERD